jgi:hypothetical protein
MHHNRALADAVLVLHWMIVLFNIGALPVIWLGYFRKWHFVRNPYFRWAHLLLLAFVLAETVVGVSCPLTLLEDALRVDGGETPGHPSGFLARWLERLLFWDAPPVVFILAYGLFFALVLFTFVRVKPEPLRRRRSHH